MPLRPILVVFALGLAPGASAEWRVVDADPAATATVEAVEDGRGPRPQLSITCLRGTSVDTFTLEASLRVPRAATSLPKDTMREDLRLGRSCPGPIEPPAPPGRPASLRLRVSGETIDTRARVAERFLRRAPPLATRADGACEVATHALDPDEARLAVEGGGETRSRYLVELLRAEHAGDLELALPDEGVTQLFPVAGAAAALSALRRACGWED